jgi:hypothetical protein
VLDWTSFTIKAASFAASGTSSRSGRRMLQLKPPNGHPQAAPSARSAASTPGTAHPAVPATRWSTTRNIAVEQDTTSRYRAPGISLLSPAIDRIPCCATGGGRQCGEGREFPNGRPFLDSSEQALAVALVTDYAIWRPTPRTSRRVDSRPLAEICGTGARPSSNGSVIPPAGARHDTPGGSVSQVCTAQSRLCHNKPATVQD